MSARSLDYVSWTRAIGRWLFRPERAGEPVYLGVDGDALCTIALLAEVPVAFPSVEEAEADFVRAVRAQLNRPTGWELTGQGSAVHPPGCLGLLAFQVYAAFKMMQDAKWTAGAYWPRVKQLLGERKTSSGYPKGLTVETHQYLWRELLQAWANDSKLGCQGGRLGIIVLPPKNDGHGHPHRRLPLSQALLRTEDRKRLPAFFKVAGLVAGEAISAKKLDRLHGETLRGRRDLFTAHACKVFSDERRPAALEQVCLALAEWDGSHTERDKRSRLRPVRLWCAVHRRRGITGGLACKDDHGIWQTIPDLPIGSALCTSSDLPEGFSYTPFYTDRRLLVFDTSTMRYIEKRSAAPGDKVLVLAKPSVFKYLLDSMRSVSAEADYDLPDVTGLPASWRLIRIHDLKIGPKLTWPWSEMLDVDEVSLHLLGGLKLGRSTWLEGSGPRLELRGKRLPEAVWLDSLAKLPVRDGLVISPRLGVLGTHSVWIPGASSQRLTFKVVAPRIRHLSPKPWVRSDTDWPQKPRRLDPVADTMMGPVLKGVWPPDAKAFSHSAEEETPLSPQRDASSAPSADRMPPHLLVKLMVAHRRKMPHLLSSKEIKSLQEQAHPLVQALLQGLREEASR